MSNQGEQSPPEQPDPNDIEDAESSSTPPERVEVRPTRHTRVNLGLSLGASSVGSGPSGVRASSRPPMQIPWRNLLDPPRLPLPPQLRIRHPRPAPVVPPIMAGYQWKCPVCRSGFFNMRALCGHMRMHKDRNWRGIHPPPELCKPPGLDSKAPISKDFNPLKGNKMMVSSLGFGSGGVGSSSRTGGGVMGMTQSGVQWRPISNPDYQAASRGNGDRMGLSGDRNRRASRGNEDRPNEGEPGRNPGKRPATTEEQTSEASKKKKRSRGGGSVPDLNGSPPPQDDPEEEGQGGGAAV